MSDTHLRATRVLDEAMRVMSEKNSSYQDAWQEQGWRGNLARIMSKVSRLRNMLWRNNVSLLNGDKEHPRETLLDVINCCVFAILNLDDEREWGHEPDLPKQVSQQFDHEYAGMQHNSYPEPFPQRAPWQAPGMHPEAPPAATGGQHHIAQPTGHMGEPLATQVSSAQGVIEEIEEPPENPTPSPSPRTPRGGRKIKDAPQA